MRALHLLGLRAPGGGKLRFSPESDEPLLLPSWIPEGDRESILAFYQQVLADDTLPRIEIDWHRSLVPADRALLQNVRARHNSGDHLVVIRVRREGVVLEDILTEPEITAFRHVAITSEHTLEGESFGTLSWLTSAVALVVEELYDEMGAELGLRADGALLIEPLVRSLLNPILVVEAYNALIDVQAEKVPEALQRDAIYRRILKSLLHGMNAHEVIGLAALAVRGMEGWRLAPLGAAREATWRALRHRLLVLDDKLTGWAVWLKEEAFHEVIADRLRAALTPTREIATSASEVLGWIDGRGPESLDQGEIKRRVEKIYDWLDEGRIEDARDELAVLEREVEAPGVKAEIKEVVLRAIGHLHGAENAGAQPSPFHGYLRDLVQRTRYIELQGFRSQTGMSREALSCAVEQLWTPLYGTPVYSRRDEEEGFARSDKSLLSELLHEHRHLLIEGQPGFGKTTFANLVTSVLARDGLRRTSRGGPSSRERHLHWPSSEPWEVPILIQARELGLVVQPLRTRQIEADLLLHAATPDPSVQELLREELESGGAAVVLDGLDEVTNDTARSHVFFWLKRALKQWPSARFVLTSRPFSTQHLVDLGFVKTSIRPFGRDQIRAFLDRWVGAVPGVEKGYRAELEKAIVERREIEELAQNPVMLTCLCVVHWNERRQLPRGRAAAYKAVFHWLLEARREQRAEEHSQELAEYGLPAVALAMMLHPDGKQTSMAFADAARDARVEEALEDFELGRGAVRARRVEDWLRWECSGSGVIQQDGPSAFRFWHLTFQELLAADALSEGMLGASRDKAWAIIQDKLFDTQWRETIDLLPACLCMRSKRAVGEFLERVLGLLGDHPTLAEESRMAALLHRLLTPLDAYEYVRPEKIRRAYEDLLSRVQAIFTLEGARKVPWDDRLAAAEALGQAGDFRLQTPDIERMLDVSGKKGLRLGKYPVTVQEYAAFIADGGYETERYWVIDGDGEDWKIYVGEGWKEPWSWEWQQRAPNRPVVGVSWFEAMAYCAWRTEKLRANPPLRLPTEKEWEAAATHPEGPYPWGNEAPTEERANFNRNVGHPTPVGMYPLGAAPGGHLDMAGNVWEWCIDQALTQQQASSSERAPTRGVRGGSYWCEASSLRSEQRGDYRAVYRSDVIGFRLAQSSEP